MFLHHESRLLLRFHADYLVATGTSQTALHGNFRALDIIYTILFAIYFWQLLEIIFSLHSHLLFSLIVYPFRQKRQALSSE